MHEYSYDGPVVSFGKCISNHWKGTTFAQTEQKARNNLAFRFKNEMHLFPNCKIELPGKLICKGENNGGI